MLKELDNVGHLPHIESFERFINPLLDFYQLLDKRSIVVIGYVLKLPVNSYIGYDAAILPAGGSGDGKGILCKPYLIMTT